jgi:Flp pilus assembly protein TadG
MSGWTKKERGAQLVEMAILTPFLVFVLLGAGDFARVSYYAITLANAARAGAQFATQSSAAAKMTAAIQTAAELEAANIGTIGVSSTLDCRCPGSTTVVACTPSPACTGDAVKELYVNVTATTTFTTLITWPGIPSPIDLSRTSTMRVQ